MAKEPSQPSLSLWVWSVDEHLAKGGLISHGLPITLRYFAFAEILIKNPS